jgi:branched-subunit amino acid aminotransferase/4-amino-4-deoxychorismate lyase
MKAWIWTNPVFNPTDGVPVTDRGFRYGMSLFESFPVRDGVGLFLQEHLLRLSAACEVAGLTAPEAGLAACAELFKNSGDGFARIYVTAGDGPVTGDSDECRLFVLVEERDAIPARVYDRGYDLGVHAGAHVPLFAGLKTGNYWGNLRAFREGVTAHCNEMLLFTPAGQLISASMANIFAVIGGHIVTPDPATGARPGVVREWVKRHAETKEALLTRADLAHADEIFLTNSWLGIMPAASVDGRSLPEKTVATRLLDLYRKVVNDQRE